MLLLVCVMMCECRHAHACRNFVLTFHGGFQGSDSVPQACKASTFTCWAVTPAQIATSVINWFICNEILSIQYTKLNLRNSKARKLSRTFVTLWTVFSFQVMFFTVEWSRRGYSKHLRKIILDNRGKTTALPPRVCTVGVLVCCPCVLRKCMCLAWHNSWALSELHVLPWSHFLRSVPKCGRAGRRNGSGSTNGALWGRLGAREVCGRLHTAALSLWLGVSVWKGACSFYTPFRTARADSSADTLCH